MNVIRGKVVVKETSLPLSDVLVVLIDLDPETSAEEVLTRMSLASSTASSLSGLGDRIGSRLTGGKDGEQGRFEFLFEDDEFRIRNPEEKRPDLLLAVLAPEEPGIAPQARVLFTSSDIRQNAGRTEEYLIRIPSDALKAAGISLPVDRSVAKEEPHSAIAKMRQAMDFGVALADEVRNIAAARVDAARNLAKATDTIVETRLREALTGMNAEEADRLNFVLPGARPEPTVWRTVNRGIEKHVNSNPITGYLVLTEDEAQQFREPNGDLRQHIPAEEIEPFLYGATSAAKRTSSILRADPIAALHREQNAPDPTSTSVNGELLTPTSSGGTTTNGDQPVSFPEDLPKFIGRLVNPIVAPENNEIFGKSRRPTSEDVKDSVKKLEIAGGPADVPAYFDFHQLQIAFDHVWQHAIDEGIIQKAKALSQKLVERGGDPVAALEQGDDPIAALREEVRHVTSGQQFLKGTGVIARYNRDLITPYDPDKLNGGGGALPQPPPEPPRPPRPPKVLDPPFFGGVDQDSSAEPGDLLDELTDMLSEPYKFQVFAPGSTNFGVRVTYRQKWVRDADQVGTPIKTLTLAPEETRRITTKRVIKRERSVKELQENQRIRKDEINQTMRDEAEIVQRAQNKTTFSLNAKGTFDIGIAEGDSTTNLGQDAESSSQETKRSFHEAVMKAAQEFKDERKLEVETKESIEDEITETTELKNTNNELVMNCVLFELQRRYFVTEEIWRLEPVLLVGMEMPNPNRDAIDRVLLAHSWIINRVLLDDRYRAPLDYLCTRIVGDQLALKELENNVTQVRAAVEELKKLYRDMQSEVALQKAFMEGAIQARATRVEKEREESFPEKTWEWIAGEGKAEDVESARILEDAAKDRYERAMREEKELRMRLDAETAALSAATQAYAKARAEHGNHLLQIAGLRLHWKENAFYYMQAIWRYTFRDQMFFSLCNVKVPKLTAVNKTYNLAVPDEIPLSVAPKPGQVVLEVHADVQLTTNLDPTQDFVTLAEIADPNPIDFKGNYAVLRLKESNPLTDYMMLPYLDSELGIHDPDELGSWTPKDFAKYARALQARLKDELSPSAFKALQSQLKEQYKRIVSNPRPTTDEVIVPTNSLYMEVLPGAHPLLEDFKLQHRAIDVQKFQAEVRKMEMNNLLYAARLLAGEHEDPEIDKKIVVTGSGVSPGIDIDNP